MKKQGEFLTSSIVKLPNLDRRVKRYFGFCRYYSGFEALIPWRLGGEFVSRHARTDAGVAGDCI